MDVFNLKRADACRALEYLAENIKVNLLGTAATVQAFLPLLRQRASKRVWIVSTQAGAFVNGWSDKEIIAACKST